MSTNENNETKNDDQWDVGTCCYCGDECSISSQACRICMRSMSGYGIISNSLPCHLRNFQPAIYISDTDSDTEEEETKEETKEESKEESKEE